MYGRKIKDKRRELNLSQEDLANKLFVTRQAILKWKKTGIADYGKFMELICHILLRKEKKNQKIN
ncbi:MULTISPECIES: helix-turn-helix domain-containing protein [Peptoniphilus]|uniref:helix-turn-helix domain-containing protein n=1 Tax=Peptoniphilus TaxID=162289 RepID=UPI001F2436A6|nr:MULTISPECIES: helix-turn-helix transcriptional regulator [Peptoniphilus]